MNRDTRATYVLGGMAVVLSAFLLFALPNWPGHKVPILEVLGEVGGLVLIGVTLISLWGLYEIKIKRKQEEWGLWFPDAATGTLLAATIIVAARFAITTYIG